MRDIELIKLFGLNNLSIEAAIRSAEEAHDLILRERDIPADEVDSIYYPQFPQSVRAEAERMARNYSVFYCLEKYIREMIVSRLSDPEEYGPDWWTESVPESVRKNEEKNQKKEVKAAVTPRSTDLIDYTNFGELGEIIKSNWNIFGDMLSDIQAVERVLANLNTLRAPIAHCTVLAEDEELRLHLSLRDWFRQMA